MKQELAFALWVALGAGALGACAAADEAAPDQAQLEENAVEDDTVCVPGHQAVCECASGSSGFKTCLADGSGFESCACQELTMPEVDPNEPCGDGVCAVDENCHTCEKDCGLCEPCDIAPACNNVDVPAADLAHAPDFDVPKMTRLNTAQLETRLAEQIAQAGPEMRVIAAALDGRQMPGEHPFVSRLRTVFEDHPQSSAAVRRQLTRLGMGSVRDYRNANPERRLVDIPVFTAMVDEFGGTVECGLPMLRLAVSKVTVHEEDDDWANDIVYCVIQAEGSLGAEVRVTPQTPKLDEGESHEFALESGVFWGQSGPATPGGNLQVTYDCIESDSSTGYQDMINAIGGAASSIGDSVEGDNGWVFKTAGALAPVVSTGLALDSDDQLFNAQQTIAADKQLELTNGAYWTVRRDGKNLWSEWDWELTIKTWGCAEYGTL